ncbi:MAG TPA: nucleotide exchange factor GrpE [Pyrinomonadaceae bacterium]|nr:nucleotide exchange factor GrpE [Pyrinomonadaceae bacterium]
MRNRRGHRFATPEQEETPEVRVTDRRRIYLDDDQGEQSNVDTEQPSLKPTYVEELETRTKAAERQVQEVQSRFDQLRQQLQRETDETRQRLNKAADERAAGEKARFIASLLPVVDDLHRAIQAADEGADRDSLLEGIRRTANSFENSLANAGVEPVPAVGEAFDPELHEAVDTAEVDPELDGKVIEEFSRGFRIGDRLLRPARVKVGRAANQARQASE